MLHSNPSFIFFVFKKRRQLYINVFITTQFCIIVVGSKPYKSTKNMELISGDNRCMPYLQINRKLVMFSWSYYFCKAISSLSY